MVKVIDIRPKKFLFIAACAFCLLSIFTIYMGHSANREIERTVTDQFNRQQLLLARKTASNIGSHFDFLETSLRTLNQFWERDIHRADDIRRIFASFFAQPSRWHILAIAHLDREGKVPLVVSEHGFADDKALGITYDAYWQWGIKLDSRGKIMIGHTLKPDAGLFKDRWLMIMATPTWRLLVHQERNVEYRFEGLSFIVVDPIGIAQRYARDVQSGETGYAWIIDDNGFFLSHYEETFVGEDSFTVRSKRNPRISYARVNEIVRNHMQKGDEGTDWYISGWHRGITGETKKLFAYSPVFLSRQDDTVNLWSVGVTAPVTEVYGIIESLVIKQWLIAGVFQLVVFFCLAVAIYFSLRWSQILQMEVDNSTANFRRSEAELRRERDRVQESIQRLVETQKMLIRSERLAAIGEAAAYLSHEIKNPLVAIGGLASQIERSLSRDDNNIRKLQIIKEETSRLESLLTDVRDFTRPTTLKKELGNINVCIEATLALMENDLKTMGIHCDTLLGRELPRIWFDSEQMKQVLINLIKNAAEALPGGKITILSWQEGDWIKVSIGDTGAGISTEAVEKIFDPFFTTKTKGTGLGLAVCRKIIEDHGGKISVESKEGKGTKLTFSLPIKKTEKSLRSNNQQNKTEGVNDAWKEDMPRT